MRHPVLATLLALVAAAACGDAPAAGEPTTTGDARLRVINGDVGPVAVIVDGRTVLPELAPGTISTW